MLGIAAVVGEVLGFVWENKEEIADMGTLVLKAVGLSIKENPTEADVAEVREELAAVRARRAENNKRIDDTSRD